MKNSFVQSLSVVVPALNEEQALPATLEEILQVLSEENFTDFEILVFNDGSTDGTGKIAEDYAKKHKSIHVFHHQTPQGIGNAYKNGLRVASKEYYIHVPGDNELDCSLLKDLIRHPKKSDFIISYPSNDARPFFRRALSRCFTLLLNFLFSLKVKYYNGANLFPVKLLKEINMLTDGHAIIAEAIIRLTQKGYTYSEVPYQTRIRRAGKSNALRLKNICSVLTAVWRLKRRPSSSRPEER